MPFAAWGLFVNIYAVRFATFGRFDILAVNNHRTRLGLLPVFFAHFGHHQRRIDLDPQPAPRPTPEIAIHRWYQSFMQLGLADGRDFASTSRWVRVGGDPFAVGDQSRVTDCSPAALVE